MWPERSVTWCTTRTAAVDVLLGRLIVFWWFTLRFLGFGVQCWKQLSGGHTPSLATDLVQLRALHVTGGPDEVKQSRLDTLPKRRDVLIAQVRKHLPSFLSFCHHFFILSFFFPFTSFPPHPSLLPSECLSFYVPTHSFISSVPQVLGSSPSHAAHYCAHETRGVLTSVRTATEHIHTYIHTYMHTCIHTSRTALGPTQPPIQWVPVALFLGLKRSVREAEHLHPSSSEVNNVWSCTSTPQYALIVWCSVKARGRLYLFLLHVIFSSNYVTSCFLDPNIFLITLL